MKCKNCNQFITDGDKFCRFCGCPTPQEEEKAPLSKLQLSDAIQECKTTITETEIPNATIWDYNLIKIKKKGELTSLRFRAVLTMSASIIVAIICMLTAFFAKGLKLSSTWQFVILIGGIICGFFALIWVMEGFSKIKQYSDLEERKIIIPKYSLKKLPLFQLGGYVFEMDTDSICPDCDGEIKGDMHLEKIHGALVAICNYNRKHFYRINETEFFDKYLGTMKGVPVQPIQPDLNNTNNEDAN